MPKATMKEFFATMKQNANGFIYFGAPKNQKKGECEALSLNVFFFCDTACNKSCKIAVLWRKNCHIQALASPSCKLVSPKKKP